MYKIIEGINVPIKAWIDGVPIEEEAIKQLVNLSSLSFIHSHIAVMPDVHSGKGSTIGSVIATKNAICPASVGVDLGCGMMAQKTSLRASDLPDNLLDLRDAIERAVPHGFVTIQGRAKKGGWEIVPNSIISQWRNLESTYDELINKNPMIKHESPLKQLGSLGGGNHFLEICLDEHDNVWVMLHSGSRGAGNRIGQYFIERAKNEMLKNNIHLPDKDLAFLTEDTKLFSDYFQAIKWAQKYAEINRNCMMNSVLNVMHNLLPSFNLGNVAVNCHHNYVSEEVHFDSSVYVTRKGAVSAKEGQYGIIPGSMGAKSYIVRGKGNPESFHSCSHGAGRVMSRTQAKKNFTLDDHIEATKGVECRKDIHVLDETPKAYKDIDAVMAAQKDLVEIVYTLKQILCVKG